MATKTNKFLTGLFYVVLVICLLQYFFLTLPSILQSNLGLGGLIGSTIPNTIIVLVFYYIQKPKKNVHGSPTNQQPVESIKTKAENPALEYTEEQKAAMIYSLMLVASANGVYNDKIMKYAEGKAKVLQLDLEGKIMADQMVKKAGFAYSVIKKFSLAQKAWYTNLLNTGISIGDTTNDEKVMVRRILEKTNIS